MGEIVAGIDKVVDATRGHILRLLQEGSDPDEATFDVRNLRVRLSTAAIAGVGRSLAEESEAIKRDVGHCVTGWISVNGRVAEVQARRGGDWLGTRFVTPVLGGPRIKTKGLELVVPLDPAAAAVPDVSVGFARLEGADTIAGGGVFTHISDEMLSETGNLQAYLTLIYAANTALRQVVESVS